jgi:hypothetical protein
MLILALAATAVAPLSAQETRPLGEPVAGPAACGASLLEDATAEWLTDSPVAADFTFDGQPDAVIWGVRDGRLILLVARCVGGQVAEQWRFGFDVEEGCDARAATVSAGSLLLERDVVERVCARGEQRDECIHLRRENARRQARMDAGAREIRVQAPACLSMGLVWDDRRDGFMKLPR